MEKELKLRKVLNNSLIIRPSEQQSTMFDDLQISEKNIFDSSHGIVVAMSDNIKNMPKEMGKIDIGDDLHFRKNQAEVIMIEGEEYWLVPFQSAIYIA